MGQTTRILAISIGAAALLSRMAPQDQYSFGFLSTTAVLFAGQALLYGLYLTVLYPRFFSPLRHLPTPPKGGFFLGHTRHILKEPSGVPMQNWLRNVPNNGLIRYSFAFRQRVLVTTPSALSEVLVTKSYDFIKPQSVRNGLGRILGIGILLAEGEEHKTQRKNLMPAFAFRHVKNIYPIFWKKGRELVECLSDANTTKGSSSPNEKSDQDEKETPRQHEDGALEVGSWTSRATLDIIGLSGMGRDFDSLHNPSNELNQTYRSVFKQGGRAGRLLQVASLFLPFKILANLPLRRNFEITAAAAYIKQVCRDLIAKKREALQSEKGRQEVDILSVALESGGFSDEDLVNQMMTFLVAGHETTATAMIWAIYELCRSPETQARLRDEIRSKIPNLDSDITATQIDECHYLQAFCSEVLRLWAPVTLTLRIAAVDTSIGNEFVPKDTIVVLPVKAINTAAGLWGTDADEFKPERWLNADGRANQRGGADSNYSFLTFLHGPRSCIGQKFAQAEFACLLAAWAGRYETRFEDDSPLARGEFDIAGGVTSKIKGGLWCKLKEVPGW